MLFVKLSRYISWVIVRTLVQYVNVDGGWDVKRSKTLWYNQLRGYWAKHTGLQSGSTRQWSIVGRLLLVLSPKIPCRLSFLNVILISNLIITQFIFHLIKCTIYNENKMRFFLSQSTFSLYILSNYSYNYLSLCNDNL